CVNPTPSYYVQQLFSTHRGDVVLPTAVTGTNLHATTSLEKITRTIFLKVVNPAGTPVETAIDLTGVWPLASTVEATVLAAQPGDENELGKPPKVAPQPTVVANIGASFRHTFPAHSVTILKIQAK